MAKLSIVAGATSQSINVFIQDSSSTTGAGLSGLVFNTANLVAYYSFTGANAGSVQIVLATLAAVNSAYSSGGFKEIDATNMKGWYRLDLPNAAITTGKGRVVSIHISGAVTNMAPTPLEIELTGWDNQDGVHGGLTALPNAAAAAASGLPVLGTNATAISFTAGMTISNAGGDALALTSSGSNGNALNASGNGTGAGIKLTPGATGNGLQVLGGATSGSAIKATGTAGNAIALELAGQGSAAGLSVTGGGTGAGAKFVGGGTSGDGIDVTTTSGDGLSILPTAGNGIVATANGTSKHGAVITGGTGGTSDGIKAVAGTGGVDIRGNLTGNVTGNLSGSAGSVTGAVGSVTGAVGSVTGAVGSVTGNVGGNVVGSVASVTGAVGSVTGSVGSVAAGGINRAAFAADTGLVTVRSNTAAAGAATTITLDAAASATDNFYNGCLVVLTSSTGAGQARIITGYVGSTQVATVDHAWATNPGATTTFAILAADLPALNASLQAVASSVQGNVTGSVGSVTGAVGSVTGGVTVTTNNDKTGYALTQTFPTNFSATSIDASGNVKIQGAFKKNTALAKFQFLMTDSTTHNPVTGKVPTCTRSIDGAAYAAGTLANIAENANGSYLVDFGAGDLNGGVVLFRATAAGCDDTDVTIVTVP